MLDGWGLPRLESCAYSIFGLADVALACTVWRGGMILLGKDRTPIRRSRVGDGVRRGLATPRRTLNLQGTKSRQISSGCTLLGTLCAHLTFDN
jgi:hypothetical protein